MKKLFILAGLAFFLAGCSTLAVKTPDGMDFVSTGNFTPGVKTLGVVQEKETVWMPFYSYDYNNVKQHLYEKLLDHAKKAGATGLTNINFFYNVYPITAWTIVLVWADFYMEGFAIQASPGGK